VQRVRENGEPLPVADVSATKKIRRDSKGRRRQESTGIKKQVNEEKMFNERKKS